MSETWVAVKSLNCWRHQISATSAMKGHEGLHIGSETRLRERFASQATELEGLSHPSPLKLKSHALYMELEDWFSVLVFPHYASLPHFWSGDAYSVPCMLEIGVSFCGGSHLRDYSDTQKRLWTLKQC